MKSFLSRIALLIILTLIAACDNLPEQDVNVITDKLSSVFEAVVSYDCESAAVTDMSDDTHCHYVLEFKGDVPAVKKGSVLPVKTGNGYQIVLVTETSTEGKKIEVKGYPGDISYLFHNTEFTLLTGAETEETKASGNVYYPVKVTTKGGGQEFSDNYTLWKDHFSDRLPVYRGSRTSIYVDWTFEPELNVAFTFKFGEAAKTVWDAVEFFFARDYDATFKVYGDVTSSAVLNLDYDSEHETIFEKLMPDEEPSVLLKSNILPSKDIAFTIGTVPVFIHMGCDAYAQVIGKATGNMHFETGIDMSYSGEAGFSYNGRSPKQSDAFSDFKFEKKEREPKLTAKAGLDAKFYVYPHIYGWVYFALGPAIDIKPYAHVNLTYAFGEEDIHDSSKDYMSNEFTGSLGADLSVGFSTPAENFLYSENDTMWEIGNIVDYPVIHSPSGLILDSMDQGTIITGQPVTLNFKVMAEYFGAQARSFFFPIIKVLNPATGDHHWLFAPTGVASYTWTPKTVNEELVAMVFDADGNVTGQVQVRASENGAVGVETVSVSDIDETSATVRVEVSGNKPVLERGVVYCQSPVEPTISGNSTRLVCKDQSDSFVMSITSLDPATDYNVRGYVLFDDGVSTQIAYGNVLAFKTSDANEPTPGIAIYPEDYDFGEVAVNDSTIRKFLFVNLGDAELVFHIDNPKERPFSIKNMGDIYLASGEEVSLPVTFAPVSPGEFKGVFNVISNAPGSPHIITVKGTGIQGRYNINEPEAIDIGLP